MQRIHRLFPSLLLACLPALGTAQQTPLSARGTFYIAPVIEGLGICVAAQRSEVVRKGTSPTSHCGQAKFDAPKMLNQILDQFEPGGAKGQVQVGYTATIQLLALYDKGKKADEWVLNTQRVDDYLALITKVDRPVVIYLAANHFDTQGPLSAELAKDKRNLLLLANGTPPATSYFGYAVTPFTLQTDESIPVNRYRFEALRHVAQKVAKLPAAVQKRIIAVTLSGELHHMFPDFENGMGVFDKTSVTDYSPASIAQFKSWLGQKYKTIAAFNQATGFSFASFDAVPVPSKNIRSDKLSSFAEHYDGFAYGSFPVSGWLSDPEGTIDKLELFVDGLRVADVPRGLNRLDVYRAVEEIKTASVGFRYDYAYDKLPVGRHVGQVVAHAGKTRYLVSQFDFNVMARDQSPPPNRPVQFIKSLDKLEKLKGTRSWLDLPRQQQDVYFNPLARDWDLFRASQVHALLAKFYNEAKKAGVSPSLLFSHQIVPQVNSSWNAQLFAVDSTFGSQNPWHDGMNMYGGATNSDWVRGFIAQHQIKDYGVPEFNPQQWKVPGVHLDAMLAQYKGGARFISPYFISVTSDQSTARSAVTNMEIRPDNEAEGSSAFFHAIRDIAAR